MIKLAVCVSGGGTNLQAIIDAIDSGRITNARIEVVISNNANAYALERADRNGIKNICISPKDFDTREAFNDAFLKELDSYNVDLVVLAGLERIKNKVNYTDIVFNMMPEYFTLGELQDVYEVILGKKLLAPAFRRIIVDKVEKTNKVTSGDGHRPSALFKYKKHK